MNITDNTKVIITVPEPLKKGENFSRIARDEDFLISHVSSPREGIMGKSTATDGTGGETLIAELLRFHAFTSWIHSSQA